MPNPPEIFLLLLVIGFLLYVIFIDPKAVKRHNDLIFDNRVLAFIDGLYLADEFANIIVFYSDMRRYVEDQLSKAHRLPGNQFLIEYTTAQGQVYRSHTCIGGYAHDHVLFAILCMAQYGKEHGDAGLVSWCELKMEDARKFPGYGNW